MTAAAIHIPLVSAYLCQDCESIGNCATACPACASSKGLLCLSTVMNRETGPTNDDVQRLIDRLDEVIA